MMHRQATPGDLAMDTVAAPVASECPTCGHTPPIPGPVIATEVGGHLVHGIIVPTHPHLLHSSQQEGRRVRNVPRSTQGTTAYVSLARVLSLVSEPLLPHGRLESHGLYSRQLSIQPQTEASKLQEKEG